MTSIKSTDFGKRNEAAGSIPAWRWATPLQLLYFAAKQALPKLTGTVERFQLAQALDVVRTFTKPPGIALQAGQIWRTRGGGTFRLGGRNGLGHWWGRAMITQPNGSEEVFFAWDDDGLPADQVSTYRGALDLVELLATPLTTPELRPLPAHAAMICEDGYWLRNKEGPIGSDRVPRSLRVYTADQMNEHALATLTDFLNPPPKGAPDVRAEPEQTRDSVQLQPAVAAGKEGPVADQCQAAGAQPEGSRGPVAQEGGGCTGHGPGRGQGEDIPHHQV